MWKRGLFSCAVVALFCGTECLAVGAPAVARTARSLPKQMSVATRRVGARAGAPLLAASGAGAPAEQNGHGARAWLLRHRSALLLVALVIHKCSTDILTRYTRMQTDYSGATVAMLSEIVKFPLIAGAIGSFGGGPSRIIPLFRQALTVGFAANAWIALCYTFNNLLYFDALSALSAVAYQVLSQSKTVFTAGLMYFIVGKRLRPRQILAVAMLIAGALAVQLQEITAATAGAGAAGGAAAGAVMWGVGLTLFSSFISALPNVAYEKVLKTEGQNQWVNNLQVTIWIILWVALSAAGRAAPAAISAIGARGATGVASLATSAPHALAHAFRGFTPAVCGVVFLKALNGLLIPATFKYADNILYSYAKPSSIVLTTVVGAILAGSLPAPSLLVGVALVVASISLYSSKPAEAKAD